MNPKFILLFNYRGDFKYPEITMPETGPPTETSNFQKRPHRPWNPTLLENAIQDARQAEKSNPTDTITAPLSRLDTGPSLSEHSQSQLDLINDQLKKIIHEKEERKETIRQQIEDKSNSSLLIGGFFQPENVQIENTSKQGKKIHHLMNDLKSKEHELSSLTNNLKLAQAIEKAEQSERARQIEEQARVAAEKKTRQAIEQTQMATEQFHVAIEQAHQAEQAQKEEENLRKIAQATVEEANKRIQDAELAKQAEQQARLAAEEKAQQALNQTIQTELARQALEEAKGENDKRIQSILEQLRKSDIAREAEENRRKDIESKLTVLEHKALELEQAKKTINQLQNKLSLMQDELKKKEKLQSIIETERQLRQLAENKAKGAFIKAQEAEKARQMEEKQRKLVDERAKRAVAHASKTVMHFLNAPLNGETNLIDSEDANLDSQLTDLLKKAESLG